MINPVEIACAMCGKETSDPIACPRCHKPLCPRHGTPRPANPKAIPPTPAYIPEQECRVPLGARI